MKKIMKKSLETKFGGHKCTRDPEDIERNKRIEKIFNISENIIILK
jgi:hypothetical protein